MGKWNLASLMRWSKSRYMKRKQAPAFSDKASSATGSEDQGDKGTRCGRSTNRMRCFVSRTLQSTKTFFRIGRKAPPVSEIPSEESRNVTAICTISNDNTEKYYVRRSLYNSSLDPTELTTGSTFANFETTLEQSQVPQIQDSTKLRETSENLRTPIYSARKSKVWSEIKNESTPSAAVSTPNTKQFVSSSVKCKSRLNFSRSPIKTPARRYSEVHSSTFTTASGASRASSPWAAAGNDIPFSPISSDQSLSALTSVHFKFKREFPESEDLFHSESLGVSPAVTQAFATTSVYGNDSIETSVPYRRRILAEYIDTASKNVYRPTQNSLPANFCSKDGHPISFEELCKSQCQTEVMASNSTLIRNGDRPPALPPKLRKFRSSCTPIQFPKVVDDCYVQPPRPISFPTFVRTVQQETKTMFTEDSDYSEITEFAIARSPARLSVRQPITSNTKHPLTDVLRTPEDSPSPPPLPPRCPRVILPSEMPLKSGKTVTSLVECRPPPLPPRIPAIRLSETVDLATRLTLRGIVALALTSSLKDIFRHSHSNSTTVTIATQTSPEGRTVATQTIPVTSTTLASVLPITDVCPSVLEVTVIHPDDSNWSET